MSHEKLGWSLLAAILLSLAVSILMLQTASAAQYPGPTRSDHALNEVFVALITIALLIKARWAWRQR